MISAELIENTVVDLVPDEALAKIAKVAGVDRTRQEQMRLSIRAATATARISWRRRTVDLFGAPVRQSLRPVLRLAKDLSRKIADLDFDTRRLLYLCIEDYEDGYRLVPATDGRHRNITLEDYVTLIDELAKASKEAIECGNKKRRTGAPKGSRYPELDLLIRQLRIAIEHEGAGSLTYDRHTKGGTLVGVLKLLRPYLPQGLIPKLLPWRALEGMTSRKSSE